jgi:hypothetical protein
MSLPLDHPHIKQNAFGMLMVDALDRNGIRRADVPLVRLLAGLLADALA